jgi:intracellular multiplication protein IcmV
MAIRDILKVSRKTYFNPLAWIGYDTLKDQNALIWSTVKQAFVKPTPGQEETFAAAMKRLKLTEADVRKQASQYRRFALLFVAIGFLTFYYSFYLLFRHTAVLSWLLGISVTALFFAQAYKYDFWAYQIRQRKLGATFAEWRKYYGC